jgi:hypothetical protein
VLPEHVSVPVPDAVPAIAVLLDATSVKTTERRLVKVVPWTTPTATHVHVIVTELPETVPLMVLVVTLNPGNVKPDVVPEIVEPAWVNIRVSLLPARRQVPDRLRGTGVVGGGGVGEGVGAGGGAGVGVGVGDGAGVGAGVGVGVGVGAGVGVGVGVGLGVGAGGGTGH